jgi:hypothetical protein
MVYVTVGPSLGHFDGMTEKPATTRGKSEALLIEITFYFDPVPERYPQASDGHSPGQIIPRLMKLVYYTVYSSPPLSSKLCQLNPVNALILFSCFHYFYLTMIKAINTIDCYSWINNLPIATGGRTIMLSVAFKVREATRTLKD